MTEIQNKITHSLFENTFTFHPLGGIYWHELNAVLVADTHLGKSFYFNENSIPVPKQILFEQFQRLQELCSHFRTKNLYILGDMFHHEDGINQEFLEIFNKWQKNTSLKITCIEGNHDRYVFKNSFPRVEFKDQLLIDDIFLLSHDLEKKHKHYFQFVGHRHPRFKLKELKTSLNLPCFWLRKNFCILPAFSTFCSGTPINKEWIKNDQALLLLEGQHLIEIIK
ncbi:MAG: hypothetical protein CME62_15825 [Halobacteriovoraceae bacterium]|nr:hypothetical protein [Halobacteriovoraceae bacterium]|tara:strand:- start:58 stop:729 length:672 start_codon:yes stop_codon:yes gene_type:complete